jgi:hypothetical protein
VVKKDIAKNKKIKEKRKMSQKIRKQINPLSLRTERGTLLHKTGLYPGDLRLRG